MNDSMIDISAHKMHGFRWLLGKPTMSEDLSTSQSPDTAREFRAATKQGRPHMLWVGETLLTWVFKEHEKLNQGMMLLPMEKAQGMEKLVEFRQRNQGYY